MAGWKAAWIGRLREFVDGRAVAAVLPYHPAVEAEPDVLARVAQVAGDRGAQRGAHTGTGALILALGERKIDVLLMDAGTPPAPVFEIAKRTGIRL